MPAPSVSIDQYLVDGNFDLFVAPLGTGISTPTPVTVTVTDPATSGATSLTVSAISVKLYEGSRIQFGEQSVFLTADAAINATTLAVKPLTANIADNAEGDTFALKPVYAVDSFNPSVSDTTLEVNTSDSPEESSEEMILRRKFNKSCKCYDLQNGGNVGLEVLKVAGEATRNAAILYYEFVDSEFNVEYGNAAIKNFRADQVKKDEARTYSWEMSVQGKPTRINLAWTAD